MDPSEQQSCGAERHTESLEAEPMAQIAAATSSDDAPRRSFAADAERRNSTAAEAQDAPSEEEEEESPTPAPPVKRGRPKGSKDAQPRTRTKPVHTPSKQYTHDTVHQMATELPQQSCYSPTEQRCDGNGVAAAFAAAPSLRHYEEAMEHARQREVNRRQTMYASWLPY